MSRVAGKLAWPVLRGLRRSNAPGLPDETWFGLITKQPIRRGTFSGISALINQIRAYIDHWNSAPRPFVWTATTDKILAKVRLVQTTMKKLVDNNAK